MSNKDPNHKTTFSSSLLNQIYLSIDDETTLRRARRVDKWMGKPAGKNSSFPSTPVDPPPPPRKRESPPVVPTADDDPDSFFSSTSVSSSDSSFGGFSETETPSFNGSSKPRGSCFGPPRAPRPVKTKIKAKLTEEISEDEEHSTKEPSSSSSSRALKIYSQLKSLKQPISPGMKLAKYINSLFLKESKKKQKNKNCSNQIQSTGVSSKAAFPCKRSVKFALEDDVCGAQMGREGLTKRYEELRRIHNDDYTPRVAAIDIFKSYYQKTTKEDNATDDSTCSSSDLFELDHLSIIGNEELPVYETTNLP